MGGLLYKDFISVSGKKLVRTLIILTAIYGCLRLAFPGTVENAAFMAENESGQPVNLLDSFFVMGFVIYMIGVLGLMNGWVAKIVVGDQKNKIKGYVCSLPLEKNAYVASKYIFIAAAAYIFMSLAFAWCIICNAFCAEGYFAELSAIVNSFIPCFISLALFSAAIELPLFLLLGKQKAMLIKITVIMVIAFVCSGFLFFGDLNWVQENLNIAVFMQWCEAHTIWVSLTWIIVPVIALVLYGLSYCITCYFEKKGGGRE